MFGLRKRKNRQPSQLMRAIGLLVSPILASIRKKIRYNGRARLLNRWGRKSPRKVWYMYVCMGLILITVNIVQLIFHSKSSGVSNYVADMPLLSYDNKVNMFDIVRNNQDINDKIEQYTSESRRLLAELDTLVKKDVKSHQDSIRILTIYNTLKPRQ